MEDYKTFEEGMKVDLYWTDTSQVIGAIIAHIPRGHGDIWQFISPIDGKLVCYNLNCDTFECMIEHKELKY